MTTKDGSGSSKSMSQQSLYIMAFDVQSNEIVCRSGARIVVCISVFTSRLRHGHTEGKVVVVVVVVVVLGTFWSPNQKTIVFDDYTCFLGHLASSKTPTTKTTITTSTTPTTQPPQPP